MTDRGALPVMPIAVVAGAIVLAAIVAVVAIGTSGGGDGGGVDATPTVIDDAEFSVEIADFEFKPVNLSMPRDSSVVWSNLDAAPHNATARDGSWETATLDKDEDDVLAFDTAGTWEYYCTIHPYMEGVLTVR